MSVLRMTAAEMKSLRATLKLSEGEFADRIEVQDRLLIKAYEAGTKKPSLHVNKMLLKLLNRSAGKSPKLKKMLKAIKERAETRWA